MNMKNITLLSRIARHILIHSSFLQDPGLYHGKMGIVLFLVHYARYSNEMIYEDFADILLDDIFKQTNIHLPINLENGLCGIGWGIEYLLQHNFMEGDSDEILVDIDHKVMERNLNYVIDLSINTGLKGILSYVDKRLKSSCRNKHKEVFDEYYLDSVRRSEEKIHFSTLDDYLMLSSIWNILPADDNISEWNLGLYNGCAGYGLKLILE